MSYVVSLDVRAQMMYGNKGELFTVSESLCVVYAHEKCADKTGCVGNRNRIDVVESERSIGKSLVHHAADSLSVAS